MAVTPVIILYTIGYRFVPGQSGTHSVGILLLESTPRGADVAVNGEEQGKTPRAVSNLDPGVITVSVSKDGYRPWSKQVVIEPTKAADYQHIRLFPKTLELKKIAEHIDRFLLAPNEQTIATSISGRTIRFVDSNGQKLGEDVRLPASIQTMQWAADSSELLVMANNKSYVSKVGEAQAIVLPTMPAGRVLGWDPRLPDRLIIATPAQEVVAYSTTSHATLSLIKNITLPTLSDNAIYGLQAQTINEYSYDGSLRETINSPLPENSIKKIVASPNGTLIVLDEEQHPFVVTSKGFEDIPVKEALDLHISPDSSLVAIKTNPNELYVYNLNNDRLAYVKPKAAELITRLSSPITSIAWLDSTDYLLYQVNDTLVATEIDTRDHAIAESLDTTNIGDAQAVVNASSDTIYYLKKIEGTITLVSAPLE